MLKQSTKRKLKKQQGFTLLEILVVVAIMGFLVAMVAPRFAGIVASTEDIVCDSNQQRLVAATAAFFETKGGYPSHLVNLVDTDQDVDLGDIDRYRVPTTTRSVNTDFGPATFSRDFDEHHYFQIHILNEAEARELSRLGVQTVYDLNAYDYDGLEGETTYETEGYRVGRGNDAGEMAVVDEENRGRFMQQQRVEEGLGVLMVGTGATGPEETDLITWFAGHPASETAISRADHLGRPDTFGRIVLGVGPESSLIREGMITAAGLCPAGLEGDSFTWNNYSIILPRLEATVARYADAMPRRISARNDDGEGDIVRNNIRIDTFDSWAFYTACPEGHSWPETDELDAWMISADPQQAWTEEAWEDQE